MALKKRLGLGSLMRKRSPHNANIDPNADTPEANATRSVRLFCESGAANSGEEVLHLPVIVESAVASPAAAAAAATQIRKFLSKENFSRPHVQYNSVMLIRILADNPGESFTRNLDKQFADTVKHLLRNGHDVSVTQIVRETLDALERDKAYDTNLNALFGMWRKERGLMEHAERQFGARRLNAPQWNGQHAHGGFSSGGSRSSRRELPSPAELAGRIEEARTSAKLLLQLVQSTPPGELLDNDLIKEFAERCTTAQRSVQGYIACDSPPPDDDTMLTLIETNEQLSLAASKHQRAVLQARRLIGGSSPSSGNQASGNSSPTGVSVNPYDSPTGVSVNPYDSPSGVSVNPYDSPSSLSRNPYDSPSGVPTHSYDAPSLPPRHNVPSSEYGPPRHNVPSSEYGPPPPNRVPNTYNDVSPISPSLQAAPYQQRTGGTNAQREEDPFDDHYTTPYAPPPGAPQNVVSDGYGGSPAPYHPGFQSTPSYLHRQESSANNLTMHGAQPSITEEDYLAQQQTRGVSPVAERNTVTYRY